MKVFLFETFSWLANLAWGLMDILPQFIRKPILKLKLGHLGKGSTVDYKTYFRYGRQIRIGDGTWINRECRFFASHFHRDVTIEIGNHVAVAPGVRFMAAGHDYSRLDLPDTAGSIRVGDYAWIGAYATVLQGVTIGEGAVIAAGSVVTKDIPAWTIAAGVPAKVLKERTVSDPIPEMEH